MRREAQPNNPEPSGIARYSVHLFRSDNPSAVRVHSIRRRSLERAILYAQRALIESRRSMRIIGYLFDTYTVSIEAAPDVLKPLARGDVDEAERGLLTRADEAREIRKRQRKDEDESSKPRRTRKPKVRWSKFDTVFINQHGRDRTTPQRRAYSEMRERIEQMKADARGRLKNKKNEE